MADLPDMIVNVDEAKAHLRIDHDDENVGIDAMIRAAQEFICNETGVDWLTRTDDEGQPLDVPYLIRAAALLLVGHWYANREAASPLTLKDIPMGVERIIEQHRVVELM